MDRCGFLVRCFSVVLSSLILGPVSAYAQGALTGVVKDTSGAVLPGVTVEAASPPDREGSFGRHRRHRPVSDRRSAARAPTA